MKTTIFFILIVGAFSSVAQQAKPAADTTVGKSNSVVHFKKDSTQPIVSSPLFINSNSNSHNLNGITPPAQQKVTSKIVYDINGQIKSSSSSIHFGQKKKGKN
jgi:hypothetical protein